MNINNSSLIKHLCLFPVVGNALDSVHMWFGNFPNYIYTNYNCGNLCVCAGAGARVIITYSVLSVFKIDGYNVWLTDTRNEAMVIFFIYFLDNRHY